MKYLFFVTSLFFLVTFAHGAYYVTPELENRIGNTAALALYDAGFPQTGTGQYWRTDIPEIMRAPGVRYELYQPTNQEIDQWFIVLTPTIVQFDIVNETLSVSHKATLPGTSLSAMGLSFYDAKALLLAKLKLSL